MTTPGFFLQSKPPACGFPSIPNPPTIEDLERGLLLQRGQRGTRDCCISWKCPDCPHAPIYQPRKNLLVDLPHFQCDMCGKKNKTVYDWKITKVNIHGVSLDFMIYDQGIGTKYCALFAFIAALDASRRIKGAINHSYFAGAPFNTLEFLHTYSRVTGWLPGSEPAAYLFGGFDNIPFVLQTGMVEGISFCHGVFDEPIPRLRIKSFFSVDCRNVEYMTRLIANGFPLVGGVRVGRLFNYVNNGEVYMAPIDPGSPLHAAAFIGSAMGVNGSLLAVDGSVLRDEDKLQTYFIVRDSAGATAHPSYGLEDMGGDCNVWACDVLSAWGFFL